MTDTNHNFERRAQSVVQVIISALLIWVGFTVVDMGKTIVRLEERSIQTTQAVSDMKSTNAELKVQVTAAALAASNAAVAASVVATAAAQEKTRPR